MAEISYYLVSNTPASLDKALEIVSRERGRLHHRVSPRLAIVTLGARSKIIHKSLPRDVFIHREEADARRALGKLRTLENAVLTARPPSPPDPCGWEDLGQYGCSVD